MEPAPYSISEEFVKNGKRVRTVTPGPFLVQSGFKEALPKLYNLKLRPDDVWVVGAPKSGNTWLCEIVWLICNDVNLEVAKTSSILDRYLYPELGPFLDEVLDQLPDASEKSPELFEIDHFAKADDALSPRFLRSHAIFTMLPPNILDICKVVYIARDPKDCCVSYYHMMKDMPDTKRMSVLDIADMFLSDEVTMGPYPVSVKQAWQRRHSKNLLIIFYEELKQDLRGVLHRLANFFDKSLSDEQLDKLEDHLHIDNMRRNKAVNISFFKDTGGMKQESNFIRKGIVGEHKNYFSPELVEKFDIWWKSYMGDEKCDIPSFN